jgi:hypothetical protein
LHPPCSYCSNTDISYISQCTDICRCQASYHHLKRQMSCHHQSMPVDYKDAQQNAHTFKYMYFHTSIHYSCPISTD